MAQSVYPGALQVRAQAGAYAPYGRGQGAYALFAEGYFVYLKTCHHLTNNFIVIFYAKSKKMKLIQKDGTTTIFNAGILIKGLRKACGLILKKGGISERIML